MKTYKNPFNDSNWKNPGKTFEESLESVSRKAKRIAEYEHIDFDINKVEESIKDKHKDKYND